jgi:hypothetical protein
MTVAEPDLERALRAQEARLVEEFRGRLDDAVVRRRFEQTVARMGRARVKLYLPVLAYRLAREQLSSQSAPVAESVGRGVAPGRSRRVTRPRASG